MNGYGYQWRTSPACCQAAAIEAGDFAPPCRSFCWFWIVTGVAVGVAVLWPVKKGGRNG
jgi:hypothetical protein